MGFVKGLLTATAIVLVGSSKVFCFGKDMTQEKQYLNLYGWFLSEQCKLTELGLSKDEFKHLADGMWMAINGEKTPINDQKDVDAMQVFLEQKNKDYRMKKDALNATIAKKNKQSADEFLADLDKKDGVQKSKTGLRYIIKNPGSSNKPDANDSVTVHYVGTLADGSEFDSSVRRGTPANFRLDQVVPGFSEGLQLIGEGGEATIYLPANLGYGNYDIAGIPPGSLIIFDVQLIKVQSVPGNKPQPIFK